MNQLNVRVKICGVTSVVDAKAAAAAGADAIGLNFYAKSPRHVALAQAAKIARALPPFVSRVGVFVNPEPALVIAALKALRLDYLQWSGDEDLRLAELFPWDLQIKGARVSDRKSIKGLAPWRGCAGFLLDASVKGSYGGTGKTFDWKLARQVAKLGRPVILAGGLTPENVAEAVRVAKPWAVDVASGVEKTPGVKDAQKMRAFVAAAKNADIATPARRKP